MFPSNISRKQKFTSGPFFFLRCRRIIVDGVDVTAKLEDFFDYTKTKNKGLWKKKR